MSRAELQQPILDDGIRSINFFNGRLLTGRDLTREQMANRAVDLRLGKAVGDGIAGGFEVSPSKSLQSTISSPLLTVTPGLAINRRGQTLQLAREIDIGLVREPGSNTGQGFNECVPLQTGTYIAGAGVYLLTVSPAQTTEGLAPVAGLDLGIASCNTDTIVSTLQFRLIQLNSTLTDAELHDENHLRNLLAYRCFGVEASKAALTDPFGAELQQYGLLDSLRPNRLTDCDVPLAILYWTLSGGVGFVDMWSVRRRLTRQSLAGSWSWCVDDRRAREGEAMLLQFQDQLQDLAAQASPQTVIAAQHFNYLPPIGAIPHEDNVSGAGFDYETFFAGMKYRKPVFIEGAKVEPLIRRCLNYPPTDLHSGEMVWLYWVAQNMMTIEKRPARLPRAYLIFTSGHVPYQGQGQYDLAHCNFGNYAI